MYELWIANKNYSSWSLRPWVLLRALSIPFTERLVPFGPGSNWRSFRTFSPSGTVPALRDGDVTIWDSLAIIEYLAERHDGVWPVDAAARAFARCAAAEMHAGFGTLRAQCPMNVGVRIILHERTQELRHDVERLNELWSEGLARFGGPYLAGLSFSAVDAFFAPVAFRVRTYDLHLQDAAAAYPSRLMQHPAMQEWEQQAIGESWREPEHEAQIAASGTLTSDLRHSA